MWCDAMCVKSRSRDNERHGVRYSQSVSTMAESQVSEKSKHKQKKRARETTSDNDLRDGISYGIRTYGIRTSAVAADGIEYIC